MSKIPWYVDGLSFECTQCGGCCAGPDEGFIWVTKEEIGFIAEFLRISEDELEKKYLVRFGPRVSIIEARPSNDCIFLETLGGQRRCTIYPVRPNQCRTWPFWNSNLSGPSAWNNANRRCPGINRGKKYTCQEITKRKDQKSWWKQ
jgi:Fe-S-cluster containining protein